MGLIAESLGMDLLAISLALIATVVAYFKWKFQYWSRRGVETLTPTIPTGNAFRMVTLKESMGEALTNVYEQFKVKGLRYCGFYFLFEPTLVVLDLDLIRNIMTKDFQHFTDHGNYVNEKVDPLSGHLFNLWGLKWKNLRMKLTPAFTSGKMKMMFQTLVDCSDELVVVMDKLAEERQPVEIKEIMGRFTTDIIGSCAFGINCSSLKNPSSEFRDYGKKALESDKMQIFKNFLAMGCPAVLDFFKIALTRRDVSDFFTNMVNKTVAYREENNIKRKDFMHLLIQLKNNIKVHDEEALGSLKEVPEANGASQNAEVGKTLTMSELAAQVFVFFVAGFETSSTTLTFCFYELVKNPEVQEKLREEILDVLKQHNEKVTYDALADMTYMDKCIDETLRKYPPIPLLARKCTRTYKVPESDLVIEKGVQLFFPIMGIQRDPEYYPEPEKFDPERFSPQNKTARHPFSWLPFGDGPRACIGLRFGMMQTKVALTVLLKNYKFVLNLKTKTPLTLDPKSFVVAPQGGMWLTAAKISK